MTIKKKYRKKVKLVLYNSNLKEKKRNVII